MRPAYRYFAELAYLPARLMSIFLQFPRVLRNRALVHAAPSAKLMPECWIENFSTSRLNIDIGPDTIVRGHLQVFRHGGKISVGAWSYVGEGSRIWSGAEVVIGDHVLISHNVDLHDTNGHPIDFEKRRQQHRDMLTSGYANEEPDVRCRPIKVSNDVWIGFGSAVLPGVQIGTGAIVAAHSVVTKDVPPFSMVAGNPARFVRYLDGHGTG